MRVACSWHCCRTGLATLIAVMTSDRRLGVYNHSSSSHGLARTLPPPGGIITGPPSFRAFPLPESTSTQTGHFVSSTSVPATLPSTFITNKQYNQTVVSVIQQRSGPTATQRIVCDTTTMTIYTIFPHDKKMNITNANQSRSMFSGVALA